MKHEEGKLNLHPVNAPAASGQRKTAGAGSARKVLQILFAFSEHRREATVVELAEVIGAPVPTTYRHVALLKELRLLEEGRTGNYHPTARVMPLARAAQLSNAVARIGRPIIAETSERLRETVMLLQRVGDSGVCVELTECDRPMRFTFQRGHSIPLGIGASGKMLLACLPQEVQLAKLQEFKNHQALRHELAEAGDRQFATSNGEMDEGVWACSVPVLVEGGGTFVLSVAGPAARISDAAKDTALDVLRRSAQRIREECEEYAL